MPASKVKLVDGLILISELYYFYVDLGWRWRFHVNTPIFLNDAGNSFCSSFLVFHL
jgi:hypothetical protein